MSDRHPLLRHKTARSSPEGNNHFKVIPSLGDYVIQAHPGSIVALDQFVLINRLYAIDVYTHRAG